MKELRLKYGTKLFILMQIPKFPPSPLFKFQQYIASINLKSTASPFVTHATSL
jgi:hypothetical protein